MENEFKVFSGSSFTLTSDYTHYKINVNNIKTIDDVKLILSYLDMTYSPKSKEDFEKMKHLLIIN